MPSFSWNREPRRLRCPGSLRGRGGCADGHWTFCAGCPAAKDSGTREPAVKPCENIQSSLFFLATPAVCRNTTCLAVKKLPHGYLCAGPTATVNPSGSRSPQGLLPGSPYVLARSPSPPPSSLCPPCLLPFSCTPQSNIMLLLIALHCIAEGEFSGSLWCKREAALFMHQPLPEPPMIVRTTC